jgi:RES domain
VGSRSVAWGNHWGAIREAAARALGRIPPKSWWRVGYHRSPLDFVPREPCSWENRFDDPNREFRTHYCAEKKLTALREVLAPLRPNVSVRADFAQFQLEQGVPVNELYVPTREVTAAWRREHVLVHATLEPAGPLADLDDLSLRRELERTHGALLRQHGMEHLDISEIRSKTRPVTQAISRDLYEQGAAGLLFKSAIDDKRCIVLFEDRGSLQDSGERWIELAGEVQELRLVCDEFKLVLP